MRTLANRAPKSCSTSTSNRRFGVEIGTVARCYKRGVGTLMNDWVAYVVLNCSCVLMLEVLVDQCYLVSVYGLGSGAGAGLVGFLLMVEGKVVDDVGVANGVGEPLVAGSRVD